MTLILGEGAAIHGTISGLPESALAGISVNASGPDGYFRVDASRQRCQLRA